MCKELLLRGRERSSARDIHPVAVSSTRPSCCMQPHVPACKTSVSSPEGERPPPHGAARFKEASASTTASESSLNPVCLSLLASPSVSIPRAGVLTPSSPSSVLSSLARLPRPQASGTVAEEGLGKPSVPTYFPQTSDALDGPRTPCECRSGRDSERSKTDSAVSSRFSSSSSSPATSPRSSSGSRSPSSRSKGRSSRERQEYGPSFSAQARRVQRLLALTTGEHDLYSRFKEGYFPSLPVPADRQQTPVRPRSERRQRASSGKKSRARRTSIGSRAAQSGTHSGGKVGVVREAERKGKTHRLDKKHSSAGPFINKFSNIDRLHLGRSRQATAKKQLGGGARPKRSEARGKAYGLRSASQWGAGIIPSDSAPELLPCEGDKEEGQGGEQRAERTVRVSCGSKAVGAKEASSEERRKVNSDEAKGKGGKVRRIWSVWRDSERAKASKEDLIGGESSTDEGDDEETEQVTSREDGLQGKGKAGISNTRTLSETTGRAKGEVQSDVALKDRIEAVREDNQGGQTEESTEETDEAEDGDKLERHRRLLSADEERRSSGKALWVSRRLRELQGEQEDEAKQAGAESENSRSSGQEESDQSAPYRIFPDTGGGGSERRRIALID